MLRKKSPSRSLSLTLSRYKPVNLQYADRYKYSVRLVERELGNKRSRSAFAVFKSYAAKQESRDYG